MVLLFLVWESGARTDVYGTGRARVAFVYQQFGVTKYVSGCSTGDLQPATRAGSSGRGSTALRLSRPHRLKLDIRKE